MESSGGFIKIVTFIFSSCSSIFLEFCDLGALSLFELKLRQCSGNSVGMTPCGVVKVVS